MRAGACLLLSLAPMIRMHRIAALLVPALVTVCLPRPARADEPSAASARPETTTPPAPASDERAAFQLAVLGFRARIIDGPDFSRDRGTRRHVETFGVSLLQTDIDARSGILSYRGALDMALGGGAFDGSSTIDGTFRGAATFGVASGRDAGVFARLGATLDLSGSRASLRALIEVPRLEVGSQWMRGPLFVEAGPSAGIAAVNAVIIDSYGADLGVQPTWGGFVSAQRTGRPGPNLRIRLEAVRAEAVGLDGARAVTTVRGRLCADGIGPLILCADGDALWTGVPFDQATGGGSSQPVYVRQTAAALGLTLALGSIERKGR